MITMKKAANELKDVLQVVTDLETILDSGITHRRIRRLPLSNLTLRVHRRDLPNVKVC